MNVLNKWHFKILNFSSYFIFKLLFIMCLLFHHLIMPDECFHIFNINCAAYYNWFYTSLQVNVVSLCTYIFFIFFFHLLCIPFLLCLYILYTFKNKNLYYKIVSKSEFKYFSKKFFIFIKYSVSRWFIFWKLLSRNIFH